MRFLTVAVCVLLVGCGPALVFNWSQRMSPEEMLSLASLVFIGVIQKHHIESSPFFRLTIPGEDPTTARYWKIVRREVLVETVVRGAESRRVVDVFEIFWTGGTTGDWNCTHDNERALFLVRVESGKYHVVRDWWRSIFPISSGPHTRLPLDDSHPLWERIALLNWWFPRNGPAARHPEFKYLDVGQALTEWRKVKLWRGLVRHPASGVRVAACRELLLLGWGQDECWETLSKADRAFFSRVYSCCTAKDVGALRARAQERDTDRLWRMYNDRESRRLLTAMNNARLRRAFCRQWELAYPNDHDNGCPPDQPPPATIVTEKGEVPLIGAWPR